MDSNKKLSVNDAKANFTASLEELHPLEAAVAAHPLLLLGAAAAIGIFVGCSGTKILKKTKMLAPTALLSSSLSRAIFKKLFQIYIAR